MSPIVLRFDITFHGPFHVGSGLPAQGLDRVLDRDALLPASSLKGLMRAIATERLRLRAPVLDEVFGTATGGPTGGAIGWRRGGSPWAWSDAGFDEVHFRRAATIRIDDASGTTDRGFLMLGEQAWTTTARFEIALRRPLPAETLDRDRLVLRGAARSVTSLGGSRRRGEGWVDIGDCDDHDQEVAWTDDDSRALLALARTDAAVGEVRAE